MIEIIDFIESVIRYMFWFMVYGFIVYVFCYMIYLYIKNRKSYD